MNQIKRIKTHTTKIACNWNIEYIELKRSKLLSWSRKRTWYEFTLGPGKFWMHVTISRITTQRVWGVHKECLILIVEKGNGTIKLFKTSRGKKEKKLKRNITSRLNKKKQKKDSRLKYISKCIKINRPITLGKRFQIRFKKLRYGLFTRDV